MRLDLAIAEVTRARDLMDPAPGLPSVMPSCGSSIRPSSRTG